MRSSFVLIVFLAIAAGLAPAASGQSATRSYRFELAGAAKATGAGKHIVSVRLVGASDNKFVVGAAIVQTRLDMSPENMASMIAPLKVQPASAPGIYSFAFDDSAVRKWQGKWALTLTAKVPGDPRPVTGRITFQAGP